MLFVVLFSPGWFSKAQSELTPTELKEGGSVWKTAEQAFQEHGAHESTASRWALIRKMDAVADAFERKQKNLIIFSYR